MFLFQLLAPAKKVIDRDIVDIWIDESGLTPIQTASGYDIPHVHSLGIRAVNPNVSKNLIQFRFQNHIPK